MIERRSKCDPVRLLAPRARRCLAVVIDIPERLEGDRVVLRPLETGDADADAQAFADDRELGRLLGFETDPTADQVAAGLATAAELARDAAMTVEERCREDHPPTPGRQRQPPAWDVPRASPRSSPFRLPQSMRRLRRRTAPRHTPGWAPFTASAPLRAPRWPASSSWAAESERLSWPRWRLPKRPGCLPASVTLVWHAITSGRLPAASQSQRPRRLRHDRRRNPTSSP